MDPLSVLGVEPGASPEEVAAAYRRLAKRWHPDHAGGDAGAAARMAEINAAYDLVRDGTGPTDTLLADPPAAAGGRASSPRARRPGDWLPEPVRRALGRELLGALEEHEAVALVTPAATWRSPRAVLAVTDRRLLWLADDAISDRVHQLRFRDVETVAHRLRRPLRRTALLEVRTRVGRRLEWADLRPPVAAEAEALVRAQLG